MTLHLRSILGLMLLSISNPLTPMTKAANQVAGNLIVFNDNGAWCWYQDERVITDPSTGMLLIGSIAARLDRESTDPRRGNVELTQFDPATGARKRVVLHEQLEPDDHNTPALLIRPDGRYIAMYTKHGTDALSRWRISTRPHDPFEWREEKQFDWSKLPGGRRVTYSNLYYLPGEKRLYNFVRGINDDPSIMISSDDGETFAFGGKLLTEPKIGYVNGYTRYASNGVDRIDFITTEHHPRDFNNSIYHGYVQGAKLRTADGTVVDENVLDAEGYSQTRLTKILAANSVWDGDTMTHAWTIDVRRDRNGQLAALMIARANDIPENTNFNDHRFFYARYDGKAWKTHQLAHAGARLWDYEQDYTGCGGVDPGDANTVYISAPIDPRSGAATPRHEIYKGTTSDGGASWTWSAITRDSSVGNFRPIVRRWEDGRTAVLWFRGRMERSQRYDAAIVGVIEAPKEKLDRMSLVDTSNGSRSGVARLNVPGNETGDLFALFRGNAQGNASIRVSLADQTPLTYHQYACQQVGPDQFTQAPAAAREQDGVYRAYLGRVRGGETVNVTIEPSDGSSFAGWAYAPVSSR